MALLPVAPVRFAHILVTSVITACLLAACATPAGAAPPDEHCMVVVTGLTDDGELVTTAPVCAPERALLVATSAGSSVIGIHYDGFNFTGSSFTVVGDSCIGGYLNLGASWDNRVSSTWNGCPRVRHWDGQNLTGVAQTTLSPGGNLSTLNNRASSIQYLS